MVGGEAGKGCKPRPVDRKTWERNHVLAFGVECRNCQGTGKVSVVHTHPAKFKATGPRYWKSRSTEDCPFCNGLGKVDRFVKQEELK